MLDRRVLRALLDVAKGLKGVEARWALAGEASEVIQGVNTPASSLMILAFGRASTEAVHEALAENLSNRGVAAKRSALVFERKKTLARKAEIGGELLPVEVQSTHSRLDHGQVPIEIHGDIRIRIGEWAWGDPIEFEPVYASVVGERIPLMPLRLSSDLYFGLGWMDRVKLIHEANQRRHHSH